MGKAAVVVVLSAAERRELESLARAHKTGQAMARRARIVLAAAAGLENKAICAEVGADANTVSKWRRRFAGQRRDGLLDEPRPSTPRKIGDDAIAEPKPFRWIKSADDILAAVQRFCQRTLQSGGICESGH